MKVGLTLLALALLVCGAVAYFAWYKPYQRDKNAPRTYSIANSVNLRSSKDAGGDYNKIRSVPYGSELITYDDDGEWAHVKDADGNEGYMASMYLTDKADFLLLNSIFGDQESRENVSTIKCRKALLNYYKANGLIGKLSSENLKIVDPNFVPSSDNQWQVFCRAKGVKPNNVFFPRLINPNSKFTDFAVTIKNIENGQRRTLLFTFDDDETPHYVTYINAPEEGYIEDMIVYEGQISARYSY